MNSAIFKNFLQPLHDAPACIALPVAINGDYNEIDPLQMPPFSRPNKVHFVVPPVRYEGGTKANGYVDGTSHTWAQIFNTSKYGTTEEQIRRNVVGDPRRGGGSTAWRDYVSPASNVAVPRGTSLYDLSKVGTHYTHSKYAVFNILFAKFQYRL